MKRFFGSEVPLSAVYTQVMRQIIPNWGTPVRRGVGLTEGGMSRSVHSPTTTHHTTHGSQYQGQHTFLPLNAALSRIPHQEMLRIRQRIERRWLTKTTSKTGESDPETARHAWMVTMLPPTLPSVSVCVPILVCVFCCCLCVHRHKLPSSLTLAPCWQPPRLRARWSCQGPPGTSLGSPTRRRA